MDMSLLLHPSFMVSDMRLINNNLYTPYLSESHFKPAGLVLDQRPANTTVVDTLQDAVWFHPLFCEVR